MPPVLDPTKSKVDGLAFLGLSLTRASPHGHPRSATHQTAFDLNDVLDRDYQYVFSTNDDGWLVGGGEPGPPTSYKLAAPDSSHVEIMRIGTYSAHWGGVPMEDIVEALRSGKILIPQIEVLPTAVIANGDHPPELEIRFDMEPEIPDFEDPFAALPTNWQLRFIHNQLFKLFEFPSRFCPGPFHSTILRKAEFRSLKHREGYFNKCVEAIHNWRKNGPQPLHPVNISPDIQIVKMTGGDIDDKGTAPQAKANKSKDSLEDDKYLASMSGDDPIQKTDDPEKELNSGIWLFTDRNNISHFFPPNFLPPYDTPEKRKIIMSVLKEEWEEGTMTWQKCGHGSMTKKKGKPRPPTTPTRGAVAKATRTVQMPAPEDTTSELATVEPSIVIKEDAEKVDSSCDFGGIIRGWA